MSETTNLKAGDFESFKKLSKFENQKEMDLAIRSWLYENKHALTPSEEKLVKKISQLAYKFKGVFAIKHGTLAKMVEISEKTVRRGLGRFMELGLLTAHATQTDVKSKNAKGRGHNVYVINPVETIDFESLENNKKGMNDQSHDQSVLSSRSIAENPVTPTVEDDKNDSDTGFSYTKPSKRIKIKTLVQDADNINEEFEEADKIGHWIPTFFKSKALLLLNTAENVNAAYSIIRNKVLKEKAVGFTYTSADVNEFARLTLNALFKKIKEADKNKPVDEPLAYITGIVKNLVKEKTDLLVEEEYQKTLLEMYSLNEPVDSAEPENENTYTNFPFGNWLEDPAYR